MRTSTSSAHARISSMFGEIQRLALIEAAKAPRGFIGDDPTGFAFLLERTNGLRPVGSWPLAPLLQQRLGDAQRAHCRYRPKQHSMPVGQHLPGPSPRFAIESTM